MAALHGTPGLILGESIGPQLLVAFWFVLVSLALVIRLPVGRLRESASAFGAGLARRRRLRPARAA
jgi:hypothetical protein